MRCGIKQVFNWIFFNYSFFSKKSKWNMYETADHAVFVHIVHLRILLFFFRKLFEICLWYITSMFFPSSLSASHWSVFPNFLSTSLALIWLFSIGLRLRLTWSKHHWQRLLPNSWFLLFLPYMLGGTLKNGLWLLIYVIQLVWS